MVQNSLLLKVLNGEPVDSTPVWLMRQAGRYLPQYQVFREKYSFFERCQNPQLACEITLQPLKVLAVDAAILFSDILVVPQAMGMEVQLIESKGPFLPDPIKTFKDLVRLKVPYIEESLGYVLEAIKLVNIELNGKIPLIGFAGSPFTLLCYMVQGKGSKNFNEAKAFCYSQPELATQLLQMITDTTIAYLTAQYKAGVHVVQIFDSWGGLLSPADFKVFSLPYLQQIAKALHAKLPVIVFSKGAWHSLTQLAEMTVSALGIDWCIQPQLARQMVGKSMVLQGNFDPAKLMAPIPIIKEEVKQMMEAFEGLPHIANLGHGILPQVPVSHAQAFVDAVKAFSNK